MLMLNESCIMPRFFIITRIVSIQNWILLIFLIRRAIMWSRIRFCLGWNINRCLSICVSIILVCMEIFTKVFVKLPLRLISVRRMSGEGLCFGIRWKTWRISSLIGIRQSFFAVRINTLMRCIVFLILTRICPTKIVIWDMWLFPFLIFIAKLMR